ncbi:MAG: hypothetical protein JJ902_13310 [Roseibium sp.]|nr:hypothetical protein [Roseibium sp.]
MRLKAGFYALRSFCEGGDGPVITIGYAPSADTGEAHVMGTRRGGQVILDAHCTMALVHVEGEEANLELAVFLPDGYPEKAVRIDVERLESDTKMAAPVTMAPAGELVHLSGHVEMVGDTETRPGQWLGARSGEARIEGFAIHWPKRPLNVDLSYGCIVMGLGKSPNSLTGGFVGTRRRAAPITSVWVDLKGDDADKYDLAINAVFAKRGLTSGASGDILRGIGPNDHLVGLNLSLKDVGKPADIPLPAAASARGASPVQTFRAK